MRIIPVHRHRTRTARRAATLLSAALVSTLMQGAPATTANAAGAPTVQSQEKPVKGSNAKARPRKKDTTVSAPSAPKATWPTAASAELTLPAAAAATTRPGAMVKAGALPVTLSALPEGPLAVGKQARPVWTAKDTQVTVSVLDHTAAKKAGVDGVLLTVTPVDGAGRAAAVGLDYSAFMGAAGAGYGERLRLVQLPSCVLTSPDKPQCRKAVPLAGHNDAERHTVTADAITVPAAEGAKPTRTTSAGGAIVLAAASSATSPAGDYKASPLSAASTWNTSLNSGSFSWSYSMPVPSVPTKLAPTVALAYSSGSIDGRTSNTNNQSSWAGDGFDVAPGFIERSYKPCGDEGVKTDGVEPGDLCWAYDNATISFNGHAGELIPVGANEWRIKGDDNTRITRGYDTSRGNGDNDGEFFRAVTSDGTSYYFGYNRLSNWKAGSPETKSVETVPVYGNNSGEPCNKATFADSWCQQGRRWNLDLVVDTHGNDITYWYKQETNNYGRNLKDTDHTSYVRAAVLDHIEYGQRQADIYSATVKPMARVEFTTAERCVETTTSLCDPASIDTNKQYWYDTPWDMNCKDGTTCDQGRLAPTFWTRTRLTKVTTKTLQGDGTYKPIDEWALHHKWGTADSDYQLLLDSIQHTGQAATTSVLLPPTTLSYDPRIGRLDKDGDGRLPFYKQRLSTVADESGGQIDINYSQPACAWSTVPTPQSNTTRCFPQQYQPTNDVPVTTEWFNKYVVDSVIATDRTGGAPDMVTQYSYLDGGAWAFDDDEGITKEKLKSWSQWRGYQHVRVQTGGTASMSTQADHYFLRGMDGDRSDPGDKTQVRQVTQPDGEGDQITDSEAWAGTEYRTEAYDKAGGSILSKTLSTPWKKETAKRVRDWGTTTANLTGTASSRSLTSLDAGAGAKWRETRTNNTFDDRGRITASENLGDTGLDGDDKCTRTTYADNTTAWILTGAIRAETVAAKCGSNPDRDTRADGSSAVLVDTRTRYDDQVYGAAPTKGRATMTETLKSRTGGVATYLDDTTTYDAYGRPLTTTALASSSVFDPTDETKAPVTTALANPLTTTTAYTPATGRVTKTVVTTPPATVGTASSARTATTYSDLLRGLPTVTIDTAARRTDVVYDALGRALMVWKPDRSKRDGDRASIEFRYGNDANTIQSVATLTVNNDSSQDTAYTLYDGFGRVRQTQATGQHGGRTLTDTFYDERGQAKLTYASYYATGAPSTALFKVEDATGVETQTADEYDGLGRVTKSTLLKGNGMGTPLSTTTTVYAGDRITVTPPKGATPTTTITDASGHTTELRQYQGGNQSGPAGPYDSTAYTYDPAGHLTKLTGPGGAAWTWTYDQFGRQTKAVDPDTGTTTNVYNDRGELTRTTDGRGRTIAHVYDNLSRELETRDGSDIGPLLTSKTWDPAGNQGQPATSTRYTTVGGTTYQYRTTVNSYDSLYRPTKTTVTVPSVPGQEGLAGNYTTTTAYNPDGTVQSLGYPAVGSLPAENVAFTYDTLHRQLTVGGNLSTYLTGQLYSLTGKPTQSTLKAGGKTTWVTNGYEWGTQRLSTSRTDQEGITGAARATAYAYDEAGSVTSLSDISRTGTDRQCFQYDYLARLTQAFTPLDTVCPATPNGSKLGGVAPYWTSYGYNTDGTRTSETQHDVTGDIAKDKIRTYTYPTAGAPHPHALQNTSTRTGTSGSPVAETYAYDDAGNTTERQLNPSPALSDNQALVWDLEGHLAQLADTVTAKTDQSMVTTKKTTDYVYDASGNRLTGHVLDTANPTAENTTLYLGTTELNLVKGAAKPTATRYYPLGAATAVRTDDNRVTFQVTDQHGTADTNINAADGTLSQRRTAPFGQSRGTPPSSWAGTKGFVGGTQDSQTGLTHLGAREYDPDTGRFISVDPLLNNTESQSLNGYTYSDSNPLTLSDPTGLDPAGYHNTCEGDLSSCTEEQCKGVNGVPCGSSAKVTVGSTGGSGGSGGFTVGATTDDKPTFDGVPVPNHVQLTSMVGPGDYAQQLHRWASLKCGGSGAPASEDAQFCNHAAETGLLGKNENDPFGVIAGYHCATSGTDCGEALLDIVLDAATWGVAKVAEKVGAKALAAGAVEDSTIGRAAECLNSFSADTRVLLADGSTKAIQDIQVGDKVSAADPETGRAKGARRVDATLINHDKDLVALEVQGEGGSASTIRTTSKHPFWDATTKSWAEAGRLSPGHALTTDKGRLVKLLAVTAVPGAADMHNLTIDGLHTYYVLAGGAAVLVHNSVCTSVPSTSSDEFAVIGSRRDTEVAKNFPNH